MPGLKLYQPQPWVQPSIEAVLSEGEQLSVFADFSTGLDPPRSATLVLTNRNLRIAGFRPRGSFRSTRKPRPLILNASIPLHSITGLGVVRNPGGTFAQASVAVNVNWAGPAETWVSPFDQADILVRRLETDFAQRTVRADVEGLSGEIGRLAELASSGALTLEEFERGKTLLLGGPPDRAREKIDLLRQLHGLYKAGVLSEMEFNMKKWDMLSRP